MSSSYRNSLNDWISKLDVKAKNCLDIGGAQLQVKGRTNSWDVEEYLIADLQYPHVSSPKPDIILDLNDDPSGAKYHEIAWCNNYFDMVLCLETFDYVWSPKDAMKFIYLLLKPGGTAWVSFPSFYPHHQPIKDDALRYMEGGIRKLADNAGLKIEEIIKRRPETNLLDAFYRAERMRAAKHFDHDVTGYIVRFSK